MPRRTEFPTPADATPWGLPLTHASLAHRLTPPDPSEVTGDAEDTLGRAPRVRDWERRVLRIVDEHPGTRERYWDRDTRYFRVDQDWYGLDFEPLFEAFDIGELYRILLNSVVSSAVSERFEADPLYLPLHKVANAMWQYGRVARGYGEAVSLYNGLRVFNFGVPGCDVYLDHTDYAYGSEGGARYARDTVTHEGRTYHPSQWLDGPFAYQVVKNGVHVLTIGFALAAGRVYVTQIQCRNNARAARLFPAVGALLREHVLDRMRAAWPDKTVCLITGDSQKAYNRYYHRKRPETYPDALADRVAAFYDQPLKGYRLGETFRAFPGGGPVREFRAVEPVGADNVFTAAGVTDAVQFVGSCRGADGGGRGSGRVEPSNRDRSGGTPPPVCGVVAPALGSGCQEPGAVAR